MLTEAREIVRRQEPIELAGLLPGLNLGTGNQPEATAWVLEASDIISPRFSQRSGKPSPDRRMPL